LCYCNEEMENTEKIKTVAIIGRPNVGKSSLFNRLVGKRVAIETPIAGTTRDRIMDIIDWSGTEFVLMDVAGVEQGDKSEIAKSIQEGVEFALKAADLILFVVDWMDQQNEQDKIVARMLRGVKKPVLMVVNKADNITRQKDIDPFKRLGSFEIIPVSAVSGKNTGDLLDAIIKELSGIEGGQSIPIESGEEIKLAIIGRPNVGKSTLLNTIVGEKRAVVSEVAGTTRDIVNVNFCHKGQNIVISDTAGIRRPGKIDKSTIESLGVIRTYRALRSCDIAVLVIDAREGLVANDVHILGQAKEWGKGAILAVNKLDLIEQNTEEYISSTLWVLQNKLNFAPWLPVVFISAKTEENIKPLLDQVVNATKSRKMMIDQADLDEIANFIKNSNAQLANLKYIREKAVNPPQFEVAFSGKRIPHQTQIRYIENKIRDVFPLAGTPIFIDMATKG